jgi:hypothetical protein
MSKKHKGGPAPIPPGNQPQSGPAHEDEEAAAETSRGAPASDQDAKRRLGNYEGAGEHSIQQPGGKQGPNR